jgi:hypothetical protein
VTRIIKNEDISSALLAVPSGHRHLRLAITTNDGDTIVLQEATVAAIVRAYTAIKTHPVRKAVKLVPVAPEGLKEGYARHQLLEADISDEDIVAEITKMTAGPSQPL